MKKGFTMIETIMIIILIGILSAVLSIYLREGLNAWRFLAGQKTLALTSRAAVKRVVRELKRIDGCTSVALCETERISFWDIDSNMVTFEAVGTEIRRNGAILLDNIRNPNGLVFTYLNSNRQATTEAADIRAVRCRVVTQTEDNCFALESSTRIRVRRVQ